MVGGLLFGSESSGRFFLSIRVDGKGTRSPGAIDGVTVDPGIVSFCVLGLLESPTWGIVRCTQGISFRTLVRKKLVIGRVKLQQF